MTVKLRKYCLQIVNQESNAMVILSLLPFSVVIIFCFGLFMYVSRQFLCDISIFRNSLLNITPVSISQSFYFQSSFFLFICMLSSYTSASSSCPLCTIKYFTAGVGLTAKDNSIAICGLIKKYIGGLASIFHAIKHFK